MRDDLTGIIEKAVKELFDQKAKVELTRTDEQFGDFATNVALQLSAKLSKKPRQIAEELTRYLKSHAKDKVSEITLAGPGFINFTLTDDELYKAAKEASGLKFDQYAGQKTVIETNNPNPFKTLHIGHAYNSAVADTVANLLERGGAEVHRVSYHGDVGLHVGKSMWAILKHIDNDPAKLDEIKELDRAKFLSEMYIEGATAFEQDDLAKQQIEAYSKQSFELNDPVFEQVYATCKDWSFDYFEQIFSELGSQPVEKRYLEREADQLGRKIVEDHIGSVFENSEGAVIFPAERFDLHTRVFINSRGNTLYEARDLGLMQLKENDFGPDSSYIVTANEQKEYFRVVFKAAELAMPNLKSATKNISTGTVRLTTGKMSSRTGDVVNIEWLLDKLRASIEKRTKRKENTDASVIGALRYQMLKHRIGGDLVFDINESISLEGNSGPYLQYAHARARSILAKAESHDADAKTLEPGERKMVRKISQFGEVAGRAITELMPHHVATYLYELAQTFNGFYENNRVIGDPREATRLKIVKAYAEALKSGLELLGIPAPDKM